MEPLISVIIYVILFAVAAYGLHWICTTFGMPQPIVWICGGILLIVLLLFLSRQLGVGGTVLPLRR